MPAGCERDFQSRDCRGADLRLANDAKPELEEINATALALISVGERARGIRTSNDA